jgi:DNA-binding protein HU-beta
MARKPTIRKSKAAKPKKAAKKAKAAKPRAARAKAAKPKARKAAAKAPARRAKAPARRAKAPAKRAKAPARKKAVAKRAAPKTAARVTATPKGSSDKDHLISVIQSGTGSSKKAATDTLAAVLSTVSKKNGKVQLVGFGSFEVVKRRARKGRNPATGASIRIKASKGVRFKAGSKLKGNL